MSTIVDALCTFEPEEMNDKVIKEITGLPGFNYSVLLQPVGRKVCWENCALIFSKATDAVVVEHLDGLFEWLQDLNWPGAETIMGRLEELPASILAPKLAGAKDRALAMNRMQWYKYLELIRVRADS
jgi:hypothetical protein